MKLFENAKKKLGRIAGTAALAGTAIANSTGVVMAADWEQVNVNTGNTDATSLMGNILGILLTITRYVGIAMTVFGVYNIVMSFTQDRPEERIKGVTFALAGVVMIGLKTVLSAMGILN